MVSRGEYVRQRDDFISLFNPLKGGVEIIVAEHAVLRSRGIVKHTLRVGSRRGLQGCLHCHITQILVPVYVYDIIGVFCLSRAFPTPGAGRRGLLR